VRRLLLVGGGIGLVGAFGWALDWASVHWLEIKLLNRPVDLPACQVVRNIPDDPAAPRDPKREFDRYTHGFPSVVFIHGGGWTSSDRALTEGGADVFGNVGRFPASLGCGVTVASYRLVPDVDWRGQLAHAARAVTSVSRGVAERRARRWPRPDGAFGGRAELRLRCARWWGSRSVAMKITCAVRRSTP
jgi:hypothetical protein